MKTETSDHRKSGTYKLTSEHPDIYKQSVEMQLELLKRGISWHNTFADECCPDFSCCAYKGKDYSIHDYDTLKQHSEEQQEKLDKLEAAFI